MFPIILVILDGLGDRQHGELAGQTPLEAANTPTLDAMASQGACGLMWPLGPGRAPSTPLAHWELFGFDQAGFPGRGLLEALGENQTPAEGEVVVRVNFLSVERREGSYFITHRPDPRLGPAVNDDVDLDGEFDGVSARFEHTGQAQGLLFLHREDGTLSTQVTDADPLSDGTDVRAVLPFDDARDVAAAEVTATVLNAWMRETHERLGDRHLNFAAVKWPGAWTGPVSFASHTGLTGATLARGALLTGLAQVAGIATLAGPEADDQALTLSRDIGVALELAEEGYDFIHVHTKWPDTAGHRKSPERKREVIEALDAAIAPHLAALTSGDVVVCVTADHQTPSSGTLYHSGGAVPLVICGGATGPDTVAHFGEHDCLAGALGHLRGSDLMPLLLDCADRSAFLSERYTAAWCLGAATANQAVPLRDKP